MNRKIIKISVLVISLLLSITILAAANSSAKQQSEEKRLSQYVKGHTYLFGFSSRNESGFKLSLSSKYWYPKLTLFMGTNRNQSRYQIIVNGDSRLNGTIDQGITKATVDLKQGDVNRILVKIDQHKYRYQRVVAAESIEGGWSPKKGEPDIQMSDEEWWYKRLTLTFEVFIGSMIALYPAYWFAKNKAKDKIVRLV